MIKVSYKSVRSGFISFVIFLSSSILLRSVRVCNLKMLKNMFAFTFGFTYGLTFGLIFAFTIISIVGILKIRIKMSYSFSFVFFVFLAPVGLLPLSDLPPDGGLTPGLLPLCVLSCGCGFSFWFLVW